MGRFQRHLGKGNELVVEGEIYTLRPLGIEYLPHIMLLAKRFSGLKSDASEVDVLAKMDKEAVESMTVLVDKTLELSYPDEPVDDRKAFGMKYFMPILSKVMEVNRQVTDDQKRASSVIERLNERVGQDKAE